MQSRASWHTSAMACHAAVHTPLATRQRRTYVVNYSTILPFEARLGSNYFVLQISEWPVAP